MGFDLCVSLRGCFLRGHPHRIPRLLKMSRGISKTSAAFFYEKVLQNQRLCNIQLRQIRGDQKRFVDVGEGNLILAV